MNCSTLLYIALLALANTIFTVIQKPILNWFRRNKTDWAKKLAAHCVGLVTLLSVVLVIILVAATNPTLDPDTTLITLLLSCVPLTWAGVIRLENQADAVISARWTAFFMALLALSIYFGGCLTRLFPFDQTATAIAFAQNVFTAEAFSYALCVMVYGWKAKRKSKSQKQINSQMPEPESSLEQEQTLEQERNQVQVEAQVQVQIRANVKE